jgi:hypothetical protein
MRAPTSSTHAVRVFLVVLTVKSRMVRLLPPAVNTSPPEWVMFPPKVPAFPAFASDTGATVTPLLVRAAAVFLSRASVVLPPVRTM